MHALSLFSVLGGALGVFGCIALFRALDTRSVRRSSTWLAVVLVVTCPLYWITAARPLSDAAASRPHWCSGADRDRASVNAIALAAPAPALRSAFDRRSCG